MCHTWRGRCPGRLRVAGSVEFVFVLPGGEFLERRGLWLFQQGRDVRGAVAVGTGHCSRHDREKTEMRREKRRRAIEGNKSNYRIPVVVVWSALLQRTAERNREWERKRQRKRETKNNREANNDGFKRASLNDCDVRSVVVVESSEERHARVCETGARHADLYVSAEGNVVAVKRCRVCPLCVSLSLSLYALLVLRTFVSLSFSFSIVLTLSSAYYPPTWNIIQ